MSTSRAIFAGGCFWNLQADFDRTTGIISTRCGYIGGLLPHPTYMEITGGRTGHAEAVEVTYDPAVISYDELLEIFFNAHDPTERVQPRFRSAVFYLNDEQRRLTFDKIRKLAAAEKYKAPIITEVTLAGVFYPAEEHHQHYYQKNAAAEHRRRL